MDDEELDLEKLKIKWARERFWVGSVALVLVTSIVNWQIHHKEIELKQIEEENRRNKLLAAPVLAGAGTFRDLAVGAGAFVGAGGITGGAADELIKRIKESIAPGGAPGEEGSKELGLAADRHKLAADAVAKAAAASQLAAETQMKAAQASVFQSKI